MQTAIAKHAAPGTPYHQATHARLPLLPLQPQPPRLRPRLRDLKYNAVVRVSEHPSRREKMTDIQRYASKVCRQNTRARHQPRHRPLHKPLAGPLQKKQPQKPPRAEVRKKLRQPAAASQLRWGASCWPASAGFVGARPPTSEKKKTPRPRRQPWRCKLCKLFRSLLNHTIVYSCAVIPPMSQLQTERTCHLSTRRQFSCSSR